MEFLELCSIYIYLMHTFDFEGTGKTIDLQILAYLIDTNVYLHFYPVNVFTIGV